MDRMNHTTPGRLSLPPRSLPTFGLSLLTLPLLLASCAPGSTAGLLTPSTVITSTADSGAGSLRDLLGAAKAGDTLKLASGTITLAGPLKVSRSVTLDLGKAVIDAAGKGRALEIPSGVTVTVRGGILRGGTGAKITVPGGDPQAMSVATYGGIILNEGILTLEETTVWEGQANLGGGIANLGGTLTLRKSTVSRNTAPALPEGITEDSGMGGGIYNTGTLNMESGGVTYNSAFYNGGGIRTAKTGNMTISGGVLAFNTCASPLSVVDKTTEGGCEGGGIYTTGPLTMSGGTVRYNTSTRFGGGVEVVSTTDSAGVLKRTSFTLSGGDISANIAFQAGGGVMLGEGSTMNFSGGSIAGNKATDLVNSGGGGILAYRSTLKMSGGTIKGNSARSGGGIDAFTNAAVEISGGSITGNSTIAGGNGGGINVNTGSTLNLAGGSVTGNTPDNVFNPK